MDPRVAAEIAADHGLITRRRACALGLSEREVDALVGAGTWRRLRRGVYALSEVHAAASSRGDRQRLLDRAACLRVTRPFVRSHTTAALELEIPILLPERSLTHVTRVCLASHGEYGVKHHLAPYWPDQVVEAHGFRVLDPVRTALDIARELGHPYGVVAIDRVRWLGRSVDELVMVLEAQMKHWPHRSRAVREVALSSAGSESVAETLARMLLAELGLTDGRMTRYADLRVGRHLIEVDGKLKYLKARAGGLAVRDIESVVLDEKVREDWFRGFHLGMSRLTWSDLWGPGREAAKERLRREIAHSTRLWGTSVDDLRRFRARPRRRAA